ncbi:hypothetical protein DA075_09950 [Methylobacterium currus]|uniref:Uncharacterized protein n=2 Tax=Methylobacterium currus TaxID=2051553 RepID=A0A2R4WI48_9HYPH|nr:hypothetical protein DA075_09950 [Methylobacterium currus]
MIDEQQKPPAPPAWMVEVAREAVALHYEDRGSLSLAASTRAGGEDEAGPIINCVRTLRLALERGHVVVPREWTEEELLKAAREDVRKLNAIQCPNFAQKVADGRADYHEDVQCAPQARRNMLKEGAVAAPAAPSIRVENALSEAFMNGFRLSVSALNLLTCGSSIDEGWVKDAAKTNVRAILSTLPTREA